MQLDTVWFLSLYNLSHHWPFLDSLGVFFGEYFAYVWGLALVVALFWPHRYQAKNRVIVVVSVVAALIARLVVKTIIIFIYPHPRPFVVLPGIQPLISTSISENFQSFPSGHAIFFFALATVLFRFNKKIGVTAFVAAALISVARVYAGVHWPSDIIGGAVLGTLTGWLTYSYYSAHATYLDTRIARMFRMFHLK